MNEVTDAVSLPPAIRRRKLQVNGVITIALTGIAIGLISNGVGWQGGALVVAAIVSAIRMLRLRSALHVCIRNGVLQAYEPHTGSRNGMPVAEVGSIQFRAGSDRHLVKLPARFIVRHNRYERELEVYVLADEQKPKLEAFFKSHFPEQYQEAVEPLPGFPPTRE